ncbi:MULTISPECIES: DUF2381 family protein [unclassified Corallococcus]|uniref:DUF2381 family protein n=1 Tax=unclassified Corallococcus TaxID=2685029 RepID=UPI001A8E7854|nr:MULTISPECIES: DUF2381 family protein [unclassified Corallococcus]MBN9682699.1 DUF2381 family protein [Corallococcus sp. NCSPR001]WAS85759.1 DUF2381 family protein [Corallococcus sp. NCRR]
MRPGPFARSILLFVLLTGAAVKASDKCDRPKQRTILLSEHPSDGTQTVYVKGHVITTLRFEGPVDPSETKVLGWEGRLEPLTVVRNKVIIEPIRDLDSDEGLPLIVTLADGTGIPFLVRPPWREKDGGGWPPILDQQVDVFKNRESYAAMHSALMDALKKNDVLTEENERYRKEENSIDHAYATLLANGQAKKTPFRFVASARPKDPDMEMIVEVYSGQGKAAAVISLTNTGSAGTWEFADAYLTRDMTSHTKQSFALRMTRSAIAPGQSGTIAVVADKRAFEKNGRLVDLALQIFRSDGNQQVLVRMDRTLVRQ